LCISPQAVNVLQLVTHGLEITINHAVICHQEEALSDSPLCRHRSWHRIVVLHNPKCVPRREELCFHGLHLASHHGDGMRHLGGVMKG
jgi:hypothetical protein